MAGTQQHRMGGCGYAGLFLTALATLMYEILLTRIFSVTMFYHFAFLAISVAMFGMTVGALIVYLAPRVFTDAAAKRMLALNAMAFSVAVVASFIGHLYIPIPYTDLKWEKMTFTLASWSGIAAMTATYLVIAVPFTLSGIAVSLALTKFPSQVSRLYAADLIGAAFGCVLVLIVLNLAGDIATAVVVVAATAALGSLLFALDAMEKRIVPISAALCLALVAGATVLAVGAHQNRPWLRLRWVKGERETPATYERWNSFARIKVTGDGRTPLPPFGWGISEVYPDTETQLRLDLTIDGTAYTPMTKFDGDLAALEHLKYDVTNLVHFIRHNSKIAIIGAGGGRDVLSALTFGQASITAIEMNGDTLDAVNRVFGDYTGHLDANPKIHFVNDEARSYLTRSDQMFDIIQASLVDTWAATAAGAFVLAENSLYTLEAWRTFLARLTPDGILTFSRFYPDGIPGEMYRMVALAVRSLQEAGVNEPAKHIIVARHVWPYAKNLPSGIGTILVSKRPFDPSEIETLGRECERLKFDLVYTPQGAKDEVYQQIVDSGAEGDFMREFPIDISPPTDNRPFFFQMLRLRDVLRSSKWYQGAMTFNLKAVSVLALILAIVTVLTILSIFVPLYATRRRVPLNGAGPLLIYFGAIGLSFMLVEVSQLQRLVVFLGHPVYSLSVVLFTMLLASGLGSFSAHRIGEGGALNSPALRFAGLLLVLIAYGIFTSVLLSAHEGSPTPIRIAIAVAVLAPLGLTMGVMFPIGMKLAGARAEALTPWLWGVNGAASICASVLAVAISLAGGISAAFWAGVVCYGVACVAYFTARN